ncbi:MAG: hypothetical protein R3190_11350, partial [Thermoanaerobaculia bacterium]|nr:hypothetical protein [Thermoanaerobaculia bacterium]
MAAIESADADLGRAQADYEAASQARAGAQARWDEATERAQAATIEFERAKARHDAIESALAGEGDPEGHQRAAAAPAVLGSVVERLDVPEDLGGAVDAALGVWRHALAATGRAEVRAVASALRADGLGGVPLVAVSPSAATADAGAVADEWGVETLVSRLGPSADQGLAAMLLGDVILVEGWKRGWDLVDKHPELRAVTPEGDVVAASGMILAQADGVGPAALEAAAVALEKAETQRRRHESAAGTARRAFDSARERERVALERLESLEAKVAGHTEALALIDRAQAEHEAELERLSLRDESLQSARTARDERISELRARLAELEGEDEARQKAWEGLKDRR